MSQTLCIFLYIVVCGLISFGFFFCFVWLVFVFVCLFSLDAFADSGILKLDAYSDTDTDVMHPQ